MLRYKTKTRPGLVALYDIRPGNGAGPFLQPRSPHGAGHVNMSLVVNVLNEHFNSTKSGNLFQWTNVIKQLQTHHPAESWYTACECGNEQSRH